MAKIIVLWVAIGLLLVGCGGKVVAKVPPAPESAKAVAEVRPQVRVMEEKTDLEVKVQKFLDRLPLDFDLPTGETVQIQKTDQNVVVYVYTDNLQALNLAKQKVWDYALSREIRNPCALGAIFNPLYMDEEFKASHKNELQLCPARS